MYSRFQKFASALSRRFDGYCILAKASGQTELHFDQTGSLAFVSRALPDKLMYLLDILVSHKSQEL